MARIIKRALAVILACVLTSSAYAQSAPALIAPNIFLRGIQLPQGVRYTASFIKPVENAALQNISVEITLPADAQFTEMLVSRQVQFHVVRKNRQHQLTLIWQISRLAADQPLDSFSFSVAQPLPTELEYYMQWQTAEGQQQVENFFEVPPVVIATQAQAQATIDQPGFVTMGDTGVQVSAPAGSTLSAQVLPLNFNPPAQYGNIWWCSLLELDGLSPSTTAEVITPLRRSLAPFTALQLFQQQSDGTWAALAGQGVVTADGQYVIYTHPGGIVATGGPADIQPDAEPASQIPVVEDAPADNPAPADNNAAPPPSADDNSTGENAVPPVDNPPPTVAPDNSGSTTTQGDVTSGQNGEPPVKGNGNPAPLPADIAAGDVVPNGPTPVKGSGNLASQPADGAAGDVVPNGPTPVKGDGKPTSSAPVATPITLGSTPLPVNTPIPLPTGRTGGITDGTSNTIIIGEIGTTFGDGSVRQIPTPEPTQGAATIVLPTVKATTANITDGTSNTLIIGEVSLTPVNNPTSSDGSVRVATIVLPTVKATTANITDGTSNTLIIGEATLTPTQLVVTVVQPVIETTARGNGNATPVPTISGITDGTSNTIIVGEKSPTPTTVPLIVTAKATQIITTPIPVTRSGITDGTSNTLIVGEKSPTPIPAVRPTATPIPIPQPVFSPIIVSIIPKPFGAGGTRVEILKSTDILLQCQAGQVNCSVLNRREGTGKR